MKHGWAGECPDPGPGPASCHGTCSRLLLTRRRGLPCPRTGRLLRRVWLQNQMDHFRHTGVSRWRTLCIAHGVEAFSHLGQRLPAAKGRGCLSHRGCCLCCSHQSNNCSHRWPWLPPGQCSLGASAVDLSRGLCGQLSTSSPRSTPPQALALPRNCQLTWG